MLQNMKTPVPREATWILTTKQLSGRKRPDKGNSRQIKEDKMTIMGMKIQVEKRKKSDNSKEIN